MKHLTLEALRENPWNAVTLPLPSNPDCFLLELAHHAAAACATSEYAVMLAALAGLYVPEGWTAATDSPDIHEESEARWSEAVTRVKEIARLYRSMFGKDPVDLGF